MGVVVRDVLERTYGKHHVDRNYLALRALHVRKVCPLLWGELG